jgi:hypothetical protein
MPAYHEESQDKPLSRHPNYCTQNAGDCSTCPAMVDGRDCLGHFDLLEILEDVPEVTSPYSYRNPTYCTQNAGNCSTCPLLVNGVDCQGHLDLLEMIEDVPEIISLSVTDTSDQMPVCLEDIQMLDIDDLLEESQDKPLSRHPNYCTQNAGNCSTCPLMVDGRDCHGHLDLLEMLEDVPEVLTPEVTDTSDQMPMCLKDIQMLDIDDLLEPVEDEDVLKPIDFVSSAVSTAAVNPGILDSVEALYQDIILLLDRIVRSTQWEVSHD